MKTQKIINGANWGLVVGLILSLFLVGRASADVNDFVITSFDADYSLSRDDTQGTMRVVEKIGVDFSDNNHGILRAIPDNYKNHQLQIETHGISSASGAPAQYTTYGSNSNLVYKIGDSDNTVTGNQEYSIDYTLRNVISYFSDHDELYWDINGDAWRQHAKRVSVVLHLPADAKLSGQPPICYTGSYGSTKHACVINYNRAAGTVIAETTRELLAYETLSIVVGFEKGYFQPSTWHETLGEYRRALTIFFVPLLLLAGAAGRYWYRFGRDAKGRGTIVPEYGPPDDLKPIEAGTVADFRTDNRDITATIIDLAIRGYLKIIETTKVRKLRKDLKTYSLRLEKTDQTGLNDYEKLILKDLFSTQTVGEEIDLNTMKYKLMSTATELRTKVKDNLVKREYFRKHQLSTTAGSIVAIVGAYIISTAMAVVTHHPAAIGGIAVGTVFVVIFLLLMPSRLPKGVAAKESILGLKMYLETAEKDRIEKLQSPDAPYAEKSAEPKKTVHLFEKLLPYAMVLGVEAKWAKQFEDIYKTPPNWYQGNWTAFNAVYLTTALNSGVQSAVNTAFSSPSSSSSSGFGGGGSGGGGGGGGGGGW